MPVARKNSVRARQRRLSSLLDQAILVMQAAKEKFFLTRDPAGRLCRWSLAGTLSWLGYGMPGPNEL